MPMAKKLLKPKVNGDFGEGDKVIYTKDSVCEKATVMKIHRDDGAPYYTVLLENTRTERQTDRGHLEKVRRVSWINGENGPIAGVVLYKPTPKAPTHKLTDTPTKSVNSPGRHDGTMGVGANVPAIGALVTAVALLFVGHKLYTRRNKKTLKYMRTHRQNRQNRQKGSRQPVTTTFKRS
jgi:hypothetical protein